MQEQIHKYFLAWDEVLVEQAGVVSSYSKYMFTIFHLFYFLAGKVAFALLMTFVHIICTLWLEMKIRMDEQGLWVHKEALARAPNSKSGNR